jgi:hypothetical protein
LQIASAFWRKRAIKGELEHIMAKENYYYYENRTYPQTNQVVLT